MRRRRRHDRLPEPLRHVAAQALRQWPLLDVDERLRLEQRAARLLDKRWEASAGYAIDDSMRVTVAVHAALLHLGHDEEPFTNVSAVVIHPTTIVMRGERPGPFPGARTDAPLPTLGHTSARGPVFLAWDAVERDLSAPARTSNVILHEFAHKIDALNGTFDGTPRMPSRDQLREWVEVCTAELRALRRGSAGVLRSYAATNPSEFFAVAAEVFFEQPAALQSEKPRLYDVLSRYFAQDPAAREPRPAPPPVSFDTGIAGATTSKTSHAG